MGPRVGRRQFVKAGTAVSIAAMASRASAEAAAAAGPGQAAPTAAPTLLVRGARPPVVIASENGHKHRNGGPRTCVEEAWRRIAGGEDVLDALVAGVNIVELDPADTSVGYGGLPNAEGVVQLDACCMHGPRRQAGGVAGIEGVRTPSRVAKAVLETTDHHLLVGAGAQAFARQLGFPIEPDLNTEGSRAKWLEWKRRTDPEHYPDPRQRAEAGEAAAHSMAAEGLLDPVHRHGTINCDGLGLKGELAGVTTTSGLAFKIPGRVGDSPILGAGLWLDDAVGAAGSTGRGEANLYNLSCFLIVEELRRGAAPKDAALEALRRVVAGTREKRLLDGHGNPRFQLTFYVLDKKGRYAGVALYAKIEEREARFAVCSEDGPEVLPCDSLLGEATAD